MLGTSTPEAGYETFVGVSFTYRLIATGVRGGDVSVQRVEDFLVSAMSGVLLAVDWKWMAPYIARMREGDDVQASLLAEYRRRHGDEAAPATVLLHVNLDEFFNRRAVGG